MIENTRVLEVFRRVLDSFLHGERLSSLRSESQRWLRTTEELFFRDPPSFSTMTQTSYVRPSLAATRANAYQRLFGMTLNATDSAKPTFIVAEHANSDFVQVFDELLPELWQGRSNFANAVGARPTDDAKIAALAERLADMLGSRRTNGSLSREEFGAVATLSWFHAMLETDTHPIIVDLRASASSPEERLFKIAQRVGYPAHGLSKSYFELAEPLSRLLIAIEQKTYNNPLAVPALYTPPAGAPGRAGRRHRHHPHALVDHPRPRREGEEGRGGLGPRRRRVPWTAHTSRRSSIASCSCPSRMRVGHDAPTRSSPAARSSMP